MLRFILLAAPLAFATALLPAGPPAQDPAPQERPRQDAVPTMAAAEALLRQNDFAAAAAAFGKIAAAEPKNGRAVFMQGYALHVAGDLKAAHDKHLAAAEFPEVRAMALYNHACVHALWKDIDIAFQSLREALDAGYDDVENLASDSDLAALRSDPRFAALLAELRPAPKRSELPPARLFDFYAGTWQVLRGDAVEHVLTITPALDGKGWRMSTIDPAAGTEVASSLFTFDAKAGVWRQTWVNAEGRVITMAGGAGEDGSIALQVETDSSGGKTDGRAVFRGLPASGAVDTFEYAWQSTADGGRSWSDVATRRFVRQS